MFLPLSPSRFAPEAGEPKGISVEWPFPGLQVALVTPEHAHHPAPGSGGVVEGQVAEICPQPAQCSELLLQLPTTSGSL